MREHGVIDRLSEDVDLFTSDTSPQNFDEAVEQVIAALSAYGLDVDTARRTDRFARLIIRTSDGRRIDVDMGMDWREAEPVALEVGPVLSIQDAIGNKVSALYGRAEARDFFDVDAIRAFGRFTDAELIEAARERDPGFDPRIFASQLERVERVTVEDLGEYGVGGDELAALKARLLSWAAALR
ncbi:nucleotidyl transferase AbiEii/AbiGii toxin family protein [Herbiconiux sp. SALV-R1]|nr:nucleotidyl transferase AbiEii/AbiGii toxin family protein [Herbiconiux sp. SALV-R1]